MEDGRKLAVMPETMSKHRQGFECPCLCRQAGQPDSYFPSESLEEDSEAFLRSDEPDWIGRRSRMLRLVWDEAVESVIPSKITYCPF